MISNTLLRRSMKSVNTFNVGTNGLFNRLLDDDDDNDDGDGGAIVGTIGIRSLVLVVVLVLWLSI